MKVDIFTFCLEKVNLQLYQYFYLITSVIKLNTEFVTNVTFV
jgi:hypothetical protein